MNKTTAMVAFGYVAGVAVGAAASALYFKSHYQKIADEEIASVKEAYTAKPDHEEFKRKMKELDREIQQERYADQVANQINFAVYKNMVSENYKDKDAIVEPESEEPSVDTTTVDNVEEQTYSLLEVQPDKEEPNGWITEEEYMLEYDEHDKITLNYYYESDMYTDDKNEIFLGADEVLAFPNDTHARFRGPGDTPPTILYYRNLLMGADFEIIKQEEKSPFES